MRWQLPTPNDTVAAALAAAHGLSPVTARLLSSRGHTLEGVETFLGASLQQLSDPLAPAYMGAAVERFIAALRRQESILIFGDYDVDGITSTVLLTEFARRFGLAPRHLVPQRLTEGYGLSRDALERALADGEPQLLIAVDCGTSGSAEVAWLRQRGIDVLILDHHAGKEALPQDCILVNPQVHDPEDAEWRNLCGVGLVFKFCHAVVKVLREAGDSQAEGIDLRDWLDLVALGTVADLVHLTGENRILVKHGLQRLSRCRRPGLCALMEVAGITLGEPLQPFDISFKLGPRLNACGRLNDADQPIRLLMEDNWSHCQTIASALDRANRERQDIERDIAEAAEAMVQRDFAGDTGLILHDPAWHTGVVGIVASRIARKFQRPAIVLGAEADGIAKGSGRSIEGVDLVGILQACAHLINQWGGHPMAVGLSTDTGRLSALRSAFNATLQAAYPDGLPEPVLGIDALLQPQDLTPGLLDELDSLAPFGQGNPEPLFAVHEAIIGSIGRLGDAHIRFNLINRTGRAPIEGVGWNMAGNPPPAGRPISLAFRYGWNTWRGRKSPRLTLVDWR